MVAPPSRSDSSDINLKLENNETYPTPNPNPEPNSSDDELEDFLMSTSPSTVFIRRLANGALRSATLAAAFGFGIGLVNNQGFEGSFGVARHFAKTVAYVTGVYGLIECSLRHLGGKDVFNAGVAGCCVGLAINPPGTLPLQNCLTGGALTFVLEGLIIKHPALAHSFSLGSQSQLAGVIPPLALPLPIELKESFSSFCESIRKCNKTNVQAGPR